MKMILRLLIIPGLWLSGIDLINVMYLEKYISKELMSVAWQPKRWLKWCVTENKKKKMEHGLLNLHGRTYCLFEKKILGHIFA